MAHCAWPDCEKEGTFPAPRNPRNLAEKQYFCQPHIKEFNKRWDGLTGFSENEIYKMQDGTASWQRPAWNVGQLHGANPNAGPKSDKLFGSADDLYGFFTSRLARELNGESLPDSRRLPADVREACSIFSIENPLEEAVLKKRYLSLVKQHHPDVNKSADSAEHIKRINVAYKILTDFATRRGITQ